MTGPITISFADNEAGSINDGNNTLSGGEGGVDASAGPDSLTGGTGIDSLTGDSVDDIFASAVGDGVDTITNFNP